MAMRRILLIPLWALLSATWVPLAQAAMNGSGMDMGASGAQEKAGPGALPWPQAHRMMELSRREGQLKGRTLFFKGPRAKLVLVANAPHHPDMSFEMGGLTNPTISVAAGSHVALTLLNADYGPGMVHGLVITTQKPPYPVIPSHLQKPLAQLAPLPPRSHARLQRARYAAATVRFVARHPGTYYYLCPVPGHASAFRMYGEFLVRAPKAHP